MSAPTEYATKRRRTLQREAAQRRRAHNKAIAARLAELRLAMAAVAIPPEPEWLTTARRNLLDADTVAFAPKWKEMSRG